MMSKSHRNRAQKVFEHTGVHIANFLRGWYDLLLRRRLNIGKFLVMSPVFFAFAVWGSWYFPNPAAASYEFDKAVGAFLGFLIGCGFLMVVLYLVSKAERPPTKPTLRPTRISARPANVDELKAKGLIDEG